MTFVPSILPRSRTALLTVAAILASGTLQGQSSPRPIVGVVQDSAGAAVAGAHVALDRPDGTELMHTVADGVVSSPFFGRPVLAQPARRMQLDLELKF